MGFLPCKRPSVERRGELVWLYGCIYDFQLLLAIICTLARKMVSSRRIFEIVASKSFFSRPKIHKNIHFQALRIQKSHKIKRICSFLRENRQETLLLSENSCNFAPKNKVFKEMRDIKDIARYVGLSLIAKGLTVSPLKLQKLLYYVQSWYMVFNGRQNTLFAQAPQAWVNGPVYPDIYYQYRDKVSNMCDHLTAKDFDTDDVNATLAELAAKLQLTAEETELLDSIVMLYGSKSQNGLIFLTHAEQPWVEAREGLAPYQRSEKEISLDTMHAYYKARHDRNRQKQ